MREYCAKFPINFDILFKSHSVNCLKRKLWIISGKVSERERVNSHLEPLILQTILYDNFYVRMYAILS